MVTTALMQFDVWHTECINPVQWSAVTRHLVQVLSLLVLSLCVYMKIDSLLDSVGATRVDASHALHYTTTSLKQFYSKYICSELYHFILSK